MVSYSCCSTMTFLRDIDQLVIMIIHLLRQLLQNLGLTPRFAFPPSSRIGNTLILGAVSLSVGLKSANLFLIWLFYSCSQVSCLDAFFFFSSMFKIQICITLGTLGKVCDAKRHHKTMQNEGKPRTRAEWNLYEHRETEAKQERVARRYPQTPQRAAPCPAWACIHFNEEVIWSQAWQGLQKGSLHVR